MSCNVVRKQSTKQQKHGEITIKVQRPHKATRTPSFGSCQTARTKNQFHKTMQPTAGGLRVAGCGSTTINEQSQNLMFGAHIPAHRHPAALQSFFNYKAFSIYDVSF